jgi:hypothetical protein
VNTGFRAVRASWKIIEIRSPLIWRLSFSSMSRTFFPRKRISPPVMKPGGESMIPMIAWALTVFPDPDSPTMARVSPLST